MIFGVKKLILDKKVEKVIGHSYFTVKLSVYKTTSDIDVQNNMGLQNKGTYNEQLFCHTEL